MKKIILFATLCLPLLFCSCVKKIEDLTITIYGTVTDEDTHESLKEVEVSLSPGTHTNKRTGSDGYYEFVDVAVKPYTIYARKNGYQEDHRSINPTVGESVEINFSLKRMPQTE